MQAEIEGKQCRGDVCVKLFVRNNFDEGSDNKQEFLCARVSTEEFQREEEQKEMIVENDEENLFGNLPPPLLNRQQSRINHNMPLTNDEFFSDPQEQDTNHRFFRSGLANETKILLCEKLNAKMLTRVHKASKTQITEICVPLCIIQRANSFRLEGIGQNKILR